MSHLLLTRLAQRHHRFPRPGHAGASTSTRKSRNFLRVLAGHCRAGTHSQVSRAPEARTQTPLRQESGSPQLGEQGPPNEQTSRGLRATVGDGREREGTGPGVAAAPPELPGEPGPLPVQSRDRPAALIPLPPTRGAQWCGL